MILLSGVEAGQSGCTSGLGGLPGSTCVGWPLSKVICQGLLGVDMSRGGSEPGAPRVTPERCPQGHCQQQRGVAGGTQPVAEELGVARKAVSSGTEGWRPGCVSVVVLGKGVEFDLVRGDTPGFPTLFVYSCHSM